MGNILNCHSCGGSNQLPEGKNSMFCAFCGNPIEVNVVATDSKADKKESNIKSKPELKYEKDKTYEKKIVSITLTNRSIHDISEITNWFTDDELKEITHLNLSKNNILDLKKLNSFPNLESVILDNNEIKELDLCLPFLSKLSLKGNKISQINDKFFNFINNYTNLKIYLENNPLEQVIVPSNFAYAPTYKTIIQQNNIGGGLFSQKYFRSIFKEYDSFIMQEARGWDTSHYVKMGRFNVEAFVDFCEDPNITIYSDNKEVLNNQIFERVKIEEVPEYKIIGPKVNKHEFILFLKEEYYQIKSFYEQPLKKQIKTGCFIATTAMGSYDHPEVIELRHFRDEWILEKSWGNSFVEWYYNYGAIAAKFIEKSFVLKKLCYLLIVKPLVYLSRIVKK